MKNTGKFLFTAILVFTCSSLSAAEVETELFPSKISAGESAQLKIKISGSTSNINPVKFPALSGLKITFSGSTRSFQFINGRSWSGTILNFSVLGEKKGVYTIPPFILEADGEKISSREAVLTVTEYRPRGKGTATAGVFHPDIIISSETVYTGEPFIMHYVIKSGDSEPPHVRGFIEQPKTKGFIIKNLENMQDDAGRTYAGSFCLIPVDKGDHFIGGGSVEATVEVDRGFFSMDESRKISFPYKKIRVLPIPSEGKPDSFSGDVGEFKIEAEIPGKIFKMYEEIKIPVKVSGRGNLLTLSEPRVEKSEGIKFIVEEKDQSLSVSGNSLSGEKNYIVTVIPQKEGTLNPGKIFIVFFNPYKKIYDKAETSSLSFNISGEQNTGNKEEVQFSADSSFIKKFKPAYTLAILALIILSITGLIMWEKKKLSLIKTELGIASTPVDDKDNTKKENDILNSLEESIRTGNREQFLLQADRCINHVDETKLSENEKIKYNSFKDKIYYSRYAGAGFAEPDMNELYRWLKKHIR